jgi:putative endonuclease
MTGYVYILANRKRGTLYTGVTNNLARRTHEHKASAADGFTKEYGIKTLVYLETFDGISTAIAREKQLKRWRRSWKLELIEKDNPGWQDLFAEIVK